MFGMFYFVTFFVQRVLGLRRRCKTGFAFLPVAFVIGIVSQVSAALLPKLGPASLIISRHRAADQRHCSGSPPSTANSSYLDARCCPAWWCWPSAMGSLFVPLTTVAVVRGQPTPTPASPRRC